MATSTSNLGLQKPDYNDAADIAVLNGNSDKIDSSVNATDGAIAIVSNGNTHPAIPSGNYVYIRGHGSLSEGLYKNSTSGTIGVNATLSTSNVSAISSGGMNEMKSITDTLNGKIANPESISTGITGVTANKMGGIVILRIEINTAIGGTSATWYEIGTLPTALKPLETVYFTGYDNNSSGVEATQIRIVTNGKIYIWLPANKNAKPYGTVTYVV